MKIEEYLVKPDEKSITQFEPYYHIRENEFEQFKDTIFKEKLEKRLPSEDEIYDRKAALIDEGYNWDETAIELVKWLIQYLKK